MYKITVSRLGKSRFYNWFLCDDNGYKLADGHLNEGKMSDKKGCLKRANIIGENLNIPVYEEDGIVISEKA